MLERLRVEATGDSKKFAGGCIGGEVKVGVLERLRVGVTTPLEFVDDVGLKGIAEDVEIEERLADELNLINSRVAVRALVLSCSNSVLVFASSSVSFFISSIVFLLEVGVAGLVSFLSSWMILTNSCCCTTFLTSFLFHN